MPIRVLIVDDSAFMRRELSRLFDEDADFEVVGTAVNGADGLRKTKELTPDLVTLDIEMPEMSGLQALPMILKACSPAPKVMMCSSLTKKGSRESLKALRLGATDIIAKDGSAITGVPRDPETGIVPRVRALFPRLPGVRRSSSTSATASTRRPLGSQGNSKEGEGSTFGAAEIRRRVGSPGTFRLAVIGSSTGGPPALEALIKQLPADFPIPVVIAQHMPGAFTESLAERLDHVAAIKFVHATSHLPLAPGVGYVIEGGREGVIESRAGRLAVNVREGSETSRYRPSIDVLFGSAAEACGNATLAMQLTGMGDDGLIGGRKLHEAGATIACQSRETCVVWGMPRVLELDGLATAALSPEEIGRAVATIAARVAA